MTLHLSLCENGRRSGTGYLSHGGCGRGFLYLHLSHGGVDGGSSTCTSVTGVWTGFPLLAPQSRGGVGGVSSTCTSVTGVWTGVPLLAPQSRCVDGGSSTCASITGGVDGSSSTCAPVTGV